MDFLWPGLLFLLSLIPLAVAVYIWMLRRRRRFSIRYSSLSLVRLAMPRHSRIRQHLPFALFLVAFASLIFALGRPVAIASIPTNQTTILLVLDVSMSMRAADILPSRLEAAKAAAISFIERQKSSTQIGLVAFSGFAEIIQSATTNQEALQAAVESLTTGRRTAMGSGILKAIDAIAEIDPNVVPSTDPSSGQEPEPVPNGVYAPDIIVVLTDGVSNAGPQPLIAAQQAVTRGLRIYTIGYGTENGGTISGGNPGGNDPFFGGGSRQSGGGGGGGFRLGIDEKGLKEIAKITGGEYYLATSANELESVFKSLPTNLITKHEFTEISVFFAAIGAAFATAALFLSLLWHPLT